MAAGSLVVHKHLQRDQAGQKTFYKELGTKTRFSACFPTGAMEPAAGSGS